MNFVEFEDVLKRIIGFEAAAISSTSIERAVRGRLLSCGLGDPEAYRDLLRVSEAEQQALIEAIIVPETWFFRDRGAFAVFGSPTFQKIAATRLDGFLRLLSLACSTGEEPYSITMALFDAGFAGKQFRVDAVDISRRSLDYAQRGVYGRNSFRGGDLGFRDRYFKAAPSGWQLDPRVCSQVRFESGNLMNGDLLPGMGIYDAIFCRNVLIYFDHAARKRVFETINRLLASDGFLFLGPSETGLVSGHSFASTGIPQTFAFRKAGATPPKPKPTALASPYVRRTTVKPPPPSKPKAQTKSATPSRAAQPSNDLNKAFHLADAGHFAEAEKQCEAHLHKEGPSARVFYLIGLMRDAAQDHRQAAVLYRKALYLDPQNREILLHLASLLESQGNAEEARLLKARSQRLAPKEKV